ncbi:MAG: hypothetical protein PHD43_19030, partial [Methylococcales bacterium]|nr:hypothetical protein [Methylococcales bacterium]
MMNRSAKGGARSSLHYGDEGVLIHPPLPEVFADGTVWKNNVDSIPENYTFVKAGCCKTACPV